MARTWFKKVPKRSVAQEFKLYFFFILNLYFSCDRKEFTREQRVVIGTVIVVGQTVTVPELSTQGH